jgi:hypothetical protein
MPAQWAWAILPQPTRAIFTELDMALRLETGVD